MAVAKALRAQERKKWALERQCKKIAKKRSTKTACKKTAKAAVGLFGNGADHIPPEAVFCSGCVRICTVVARQRESG